MALVLKDRVQETTTTTGTGSFTLLGAVTEFQTFSSAIGNGNTTYYAVYLSGGNEWEVGIGTVGAGTLSRDTILASSNSGNIVNFSAGTKYVFCNYPAETSVFSSNNTTATAGQVLVYNGAGVAPSWQNKGTVTSVGLSSTADVITITGSPVTSSGTIAVNFNGLTSQYVRGDGSKANFPVTPGGGGASISYYLNGGTNQGTFVGNTYYEMSKTPVIGSAANFSIAANGYIAQFITDANDPSLLSIPAGNWNFEMYFSASSAGGNPNFYVELYKYDGSAFTLIASSSGSPEDITGGTSTDLYITALAVPDTTLALTDRLAIRVYVNNSGRTITLHTQDNTLCQIITTFTTGITALNGLTAQVQNFATGTAGTDFNISSSTATHTFNIPSASATNRGLLTSADWTTFNSKGTVSSVAATGGTGISVSGSPITGSGTLTITNTAPDQVVSLTAGTGIAVTGTYPNFTIDNTNTATGTVTSVDATVPSIFSVSGVPITGSGTIAMTYSGTALPVANGGTGLTSPGANGNVLTSNGTAWASVAPTAPVGPILFNYDSVTANQTISAGTNGFSVGPMTVASGVSVTVASGQRWVII